MRGRVTAGPVRRRRPRNRQWDALVERRIELNYRLDPELAAAIMPSSVRPQTVNGCAVAGISMVRLSPFGRAIPGSRVENAAHRIAVEWDVADRTRYGTWVIRRDTSRWAVGAGRVFPAGPQHARFDVQESPDHLRVAYAGRQLSVETELDVTQQLRGSELFADVDAACRFLYCADGTIDASRWAVEAATIRIAYSSWLADAARFPSGSLTLDSALVLRRKPIQWVGAPTFARALLAGSRMPLPAA